MNVPLPLFFTQVPTSLTIWINWCTIIFSWTAHWPGCWFNHTDSECGIQYGGFRDVRNCPVGPRLENPYFQGSHHAIMAECRISGRGEYQRAKKSPGLSFSSRREWICASSASVNIQVIAILSSVSHASGWSNTQPWWVASPGRHPVPSPWLIGFVCIYISTNDA